MKKRGPDSLEGFFIAFICCLITTLMSGTAGLSSMLFVACITRYGTDRNSAAFPFTLSNVLQALSGPFAGYFAKKFSVRAVVFAGSILAFLGIAACFFAEDITTITVLWGIVFGTGLGMSSLLLPAVINDYFYKQRSKALGMCYFGSPIGFFVLPPIFEILLDKYGLSGTFLFLSAINMHCIPLSLLLRQPSFKLKGEKSPFDHEEKKSSCSYEVEKKPCDRIHRLGSGKHLEKNATADVMNASSSYRRRYSVEYLWNQKPSAEMKISKNKPYVLVLNKKQQSDSFEPGVMSRSYRKIHKNYYAQSCVSLAGLENKSKTFHSDFGSRINNESSTSNLFHSVPTSTDGNMADNSKDLKVIKNVDSRNLLRYPPKPRNYIEFSTIFFGTVQDIHSCSDTGHRCDLKGRPGLNELETNKRSSEDSNHCYYNESFFISEEVNRASLILPEVPKLVKYTKIDEFPVADSKNDLRTNSVIPSTKVATSRFKDSLLFTLYFNPVFLLLCIINGIATLHFYTLTTVIIDFSRDLQIDLSFEKFIMMCISLMGAFGMLGFGWVTDGGYMARNRFAALTQLIGCLSTAILPFMTGFGTLMIPLSIWCVCQASFIPLIPAIIAEHLKEDVQTVAVSACNVLSGPMYLIIPPLIGYFRDDGGSYDNIFYLLGSLTFVNSLALFVIPYLTRWINKS